MGTGNRSEVRRFYFALGVGILVTVLAGWTGMLGITLARRLNPFVFLVVNMILFVDLYDLLLRLFLMRRQGRGRGPSPELTTSVPPTQQVFTDEEVRAGLQPFAILVSDYNFPKEDMDWFLREITPYRDHLWVIDDCSTDDTWARLKASGVRALRCPRNRNKPGAIREVANALPEEIRTVMVLDPDARILNRSRGKVSDLERVLFEFQQSGMAAVCPRLVLRHKGLLERMQAFEFCLSFSLGRRSLADHCVTSGISVYRRDALDLLLTRHTLSVYAEDLKNAFLLLGAGERIYYDARLVVETEGKPTWRAWFSQRVGWFYGLFKVYREHIGDALAGPVDRSDGRDFSFLYHFVIYTGGFMVAFHPFKVWALGLLTLSALTGLDGLLRLGWMPEALAIDPVYFALAYSKYVGLSLLAIFVIADRDERRRFLPVVPLYFLYTLVHIVPATIGFLNWFSLRFVKRRIYQDHFQSEATLRREFMGGNAT